MKFWSDDFDDGQPIPASLAFGKPDGSGRIALSDNRSPHLAWADAPAGTRSFAILCIDPDVPTVPDTVNRDDAVIPVDQPRAEFVHWLIANLPADCHQLPNGSCAQGIVPRGKQAPPGPAGSVQGINDYTGWFAGDADMAGDYLGYDGPCPPYNDARLHRYYFRLHALDVAQLALPERFTAADLIAAMEGHVLGQAEFFGTYTNNAAML